MDIKLVNYVIETTFNTHLQKEEEEEEDYKGSNNNSSSKNIISMLNFESITDSIKKQEKTFFSYTYILELLVRHLSYINHKYIKKKLQ